MGVKYKRCDTCENMVVESLICNERLFPDAICTTCVKVGFRDGTLFRDEESFERTGVRHWGLRVGPYDEVELPLSAREKHDELYGLARVERSGSERFYGPGDRTTPRYPLVASNVAFGYVYKVEDIQANVDREKKLKLSQ